MWTHRDPDGSPAQALDLRKPRYVTLGQQPTPKEAPWEVPKTFEHGWVPGLARRCELLWKFSEKAPSCSGICIKNAPTDAVYIMPCLEGALILAYVMTL